jgi:hypothetical protein
MNLSTGQLLQMQGSGRGSGNRRWCEWELWDGLRSDEIVVTRLRERDRCGDRWMDNLHSLSAKVSLSKRNKVFEVGSGWLR